MTERTDLPNKPRRRGNPNFRKAVDDSTRTSIADEALSARGLMTRQTVIDHSGFTVREVRSYIQRGDLPEKGVNTKGWKLYSIEDVERLMKLYKQSRTVASTRKVIVTDPPESIFTSEDSVEIISRIKKGMSLDDVHIETRLHPSIILAVVKEYEALTGAMFVPAAILKQINLLPCDGVRPIDTSEKLFTFIEGLAMCKECKSGQRRLCVACSRTHTARAVEDAVIRTVREVKAQASQAATVPTSHGNPNGAIHQEPAPVDQPPK